MLDRLIFASIQGFVALGGVWLICLIGRRLPASVKVWLWRLALLKMAIALVLPAPTLRLLPEQVAKKSPAPIVKAGPPKDMTLTVSLTDAEMSQVLSSLPKTPPMAVTEKPAPAVPASSAKSPLAWPWIVWILGCAAFAIAAGAALAKARQSARATLPIDDMEVEITAWEAAAMTGLASAPHVRKLDHDGSPFVIGLLKPLVAVPASLLKELRALRFALLHEFTHVRRGDLRWSFAMTMMRALFWFHPLAWIAEREHRVQSEIACDEFVVRSSDSRRDYALTLVRLAVLGTPLSGGSAGLGAVGSRRTLLRRLSAMSKPFNRKFTYRAALAVALPAAVLLVPIHLAAREPQQLPASDPSVPLVVPVISPSDLDDPTLPAIEGILDDPVVPAKAPVTQKVAPKIALVSDRLVALKVAQQDEKLTPEQKAQIQREIHKAMEELHRVLREELPKALAEAHKAGNGGPDMKNLQPQIEEAIRTALAAAQKALDGLREGGDFKIERDMLSPENRKELSDEQHKAMIELLNAKGQLLKVRQDDMEAARKELLKARGEIKLDAGDREDMRKAMIELEKAKGQMKLDVDQAHAKVLKDLMTKDGQLKIELKDLPELDNLDGTIRLQVEKALRDSHDAMNQAKVLRLNRDGQVMELKGLDDLNGTVRIQMEQAEKQMHDAMKQLREIRIENGKIIIDGKEIPLSELKDGKIPGMPQIEIQQGGPDVRLKGYTVQTPRATKDGDGQLFRYYVTPARPGQNEPKGYVIAPRAKADDSPYILTPRAKMEWKVNASPKGYAIVSQDGKTLFKGNGKGWISDGKPLTKEQMKRVAEIDAQIKKLMKERSKLSPNQFFFTPGAKNEEPESPFWFSPSYPGLFPSPWSPEKAKDAPKAETPPKAPEDPLVRA